MDFPMPETLQTADGRPRRLGVELEFAGLPLGEISSIVHELYGGRLEKNNAFVHHVRDTVWGDFQIEIDTALLKERSYLRYLAAIGIEFETPETRDRVEDTLARLAGTVVPHEIVTPPIPFADIHQLEQLRHRLQTRNARGTRASVLYAFGLHLNPELVRTDGPTILRHLRAFLLLWDWLVTRGEIDWSRRMTPFINEFPAAYRDLVLDNDYQPDIDRLLQDYLRHNPTRNRALDLLPVFRELRGDEAVRGVPDASLVKARPAFHYRLPNCRIDEPNWRLADEWAGWVAVEWLAAREGLTRTMVDAWQARTDASITPVDQVWADRCRHWLNGF